MLKIAKNSIIALAVLASSVVASDILATVNGKNVTIQDAQAFVKAQAPKANFTDLKPEEKKMIVDRLIEKELFTELAATEGYEKKPEFKRNMEKIKNELLVNMWMKTQMDNAIVSDSEAKDFYSKNSVRFIGKASMNARHILLKTVEEAQAVINEMKTLKGEALKEKFIELAKTKSTGPSGPKGGDLGTFTKEQMVPEFSKGAWALEDGQITMAPVKTQFGFHVIYLDKKTPAQTIAYEKVKEQIILSLKQTQFASKIQAAAKELKAKAKIVDMSAKK